MVAANFKDLTGRRFGWLKVIGRHPDNSAKGYAQWVCECACGEMTVAKGNRLRNGVKRSCGCMQPLAVSAANRRNGWYPQRAKKRKFGAPDGSVASQEAPPTTAVKQLVGSERAERAPNASNHRNPAIPSRDGTPGVAGAGGPGAEEGAPGRTRST